MGFIIHRAAGEHTLLRQVSGEALRIGRDAGAGLRLDDAAVGLDHAVIRAEPGGWRIEDRGSVTGTYLNGEPVSAARLAAGDVVEIGGYRLKVQITHPDDPLFVHVAAVGAGAAESPRPARGSATGSLRLDELVARAREAGRPPPSAVTDTGPLRRLAEIAAAADRPSVRGKERRARPATDTGPLRRLGEIAAEAEARVEAAVEAPEEAETGPVALPGAGAPDAAPADRETAAVPVRREAGIAEREAREPETSAVAIPEEPGAAAERATGPAGIPGEPGAEAEGETGPVEIPSGEALPGIERTDGEAAIPPGSPAPPPAAAEPGVAQAAPARAPAAAAAEPAAAPRPAPAPYRPAPAAPAAAVAAPPRIDYASAYSLARPGLTKGTLTLLAAAAALAAVVALAAGGRHDWFMPGISSAHARIVDPGRPPAGGGSGGEGGEDGGGAEAAAAADPRRREVEERGCLACHRPWRGPAAVEEGCAACHRPEAAPHAALLAGAAVGPACGECHSEHRDRPLVVRGDDAGCRGCHGDLARIAAAAGGTPAVAARVTSFAEDHPELVIEVAAAGGGVRRLSLDDPAARAADPGALAFDHRLHRVHAAGEAPVESAPLRGPEGAVTLECGSCHRPDPRTGGMQPIEFERDCAACHRLTFDRAYPDDPAPHAEPRAVEDFLVGLYSRAAGGDGGRGQSLRERRLGIVRGGGRARLPPGVDRQVADASRTLFRSQCAVCHRVDLDAVPLPAVEPPRLPDAWMPGARFSHLDHGEFACSECHAAAASSTETADVLLPGIAACRTCHGAGRGAAARGGRLGCSECHSYHHPAEPQPAGRVEARTASLEARPR